MTEGVILVDVAHVLLGTAEFAHGMSDSAVTVGGQEPPVDTIGGHARIPSASLLATGLDAGDVMPSRGNGREEVGLTRVTCWPRPTMPTPSSPGASSEVIHSLLSCRAC